MGIITFIVVLVALIIVHEFGHFVVAKWSKMRVDEFGLGYPPKLWGKKIGETEYTLNALPFGGFVKIHGEDGGSDAKRAFTSRPRILQALVLLAGVAMNVLLAFVLLFVVLSSGAPRALAPDQVASASDVELVVTYAVPGTPAADAGIKSGDVILEAVYGNTSFSGSEVDSFVDFVAGASVPIPTLPLANIRIFSSLLVAKRKSAFSNKKT